MIETSPPPARRTPRQLARHVGLPDILPVGTLDARPDGTPISVVARQLGDHIDTRALTEAGALASVKGCHFVFRYGAVVSFGAEPAAIDRFDAMLAAAVIEPEAVREVEHAVMLAAARDGDRVDNEGRILLADTAPARLELVAIVLARNVVLSRNEEQVSEAFDRIAPLVANLREHGRATFPIRQAMRLVGEVLAARHRVMGTVQVDERPDVLWDNPELDRLYARLEAEYELDERAEVLERKFVALGDFAEVLLDIVQGKRAFRLEVAVVVLIAFEIALALIAMLPR